MLFLCCPTKPSNPSLIHANGDMATTLGLSDEDLFSPLFKYVFRNLHLSQYQPFALCYAGHLGNWVDNWVMARYKITEVVHEDKTYTLQLKGAGPTPYSRTADGFAVLLSIREYLCAEAMHYLGVPTTRSLSLMPRSWLRDVV
jgi:uncharacterized protein YdiU (UPF0061 family)